jgi:hypothetical protein
MLNRARRLTVVNSVLSSMPTYHFTVFPLAVRARKKIDKIRRSFLRKEEDNANEGHCLVNWPTVCKPNELGGMGVPDLERSRRALCLRWLWQEWGDGPKPWVGTEMPCNDTDRLLFNCSTTVTIGNGNKARFWHHGWLEGEAPRFLVPNLFKLVRRKNKTVRQELQNDNWIRVLQTRVTTTTQIQEFISLWIKIQSVHLQPEVQDSITWKWTVDRNYSTRSAYRVPFQGSHRKFRHDLIWKAKAENKCKIHAWILMHGKIITADNLKKKWVASPRPLCLV